MPTHPNQPPTDSRKKVGAQGGKRQITLRFDADLLDRLDGWCASQPAPPDRTAAIEAAVREFLGRYDRRQ